MFSTAKEKLGRELFDWDSKKTPKDPERVALMERLKDEQRQREQQVRVERSDTESERDQHAL